MMTRQKQKKGVSPIIGVILFVVITVALGSTVFFISTNTAQQLTEPKPNVVEYETSLETQQYYDSVNDSYFNGGVVTFRYLQGDEINIENINIVVDLSEACGKTERIVNLPAKGENGNRLTDENVQSGNINSSPISGGLSTDIGQLKSSTSNSFEPTSEIQFRISSSDCELDAGDNVTVSVTHTPSKSTIMTQEFVVDEYTPGD